MPGEIASSPSKATLSKNEMKGYYKEFLRAIERNGQSDIDACLKDSKSGKLTKEQLAELFREAIRSDSIIALKWILNQENAASFSMSLIDSSLKKSDNIEVVRLLIEFALQHEYLSAHTKKQIDEDHLRGEGKLIDIIKSSSHRIGLMGAINIGDQSGGEVVNLEGNPAIHSFRYLMESLSDSASRSERIQSIYDAVKFTYALNAFLDNDSQIKQMLHARYESGSIVMLSTGWQFHSLGMSLQYDAKNNKTYVSIANRGSGLLKACAVNDAAKAMVDAHGDKAVGNIVYELPGKLPAVFFNDFGVIRDAASVKQEDFTAKLAVFLSSAKPIAVLTGGLQAQGTCTYVNPKRAVEGALFIDQIVNGGEVNAGLTSRVYQEYKEYSQRDKAAACERLSVYYKACVEEKNESAIAALEKLISTIILSHQTDKHDYSEIAFSAALYSILPKHVQEKLQPFLSADFKAYNQSAHMKDKYVAYQRAERKSGEVLFVGDFEVMHKNQEKIKQLQNFFKENRITNNDILKVIIDADGVRVYPAYATGKLAQLNDLLVNQLGASIERKTDIRGLFITNLSELKFKQSADTAIPAPVIEDKTHKMTRSRLRRMFANDEISTNELKSLLDMGLNPNLQFKDGSTILHIVVAKNQTDLLRLILKNGANPLIVDPENNQTAMDIARLVDNKESIKLLTTQANLLKFREVLMSSPNQAEIKNELKRHYFDVYNAVQLLTESPPSIEKAAKIFHAASLRRKSGGAENPLAGWVNEVISLLEKNRKGKVGVAEFEDAVKKYMSEFSVVLVKNSEAATVKSTTIKTVNDDEYGQVEKRSIKGR